MGSLYLFACQQALKMRYFYWLRVKNSNHLHTEVSLGYLKDTKFYLESKASYSHKQYCFIQAVFDHLVVEYCPFSDSSVVSLRSLPWPKYT